MEVIKEGYAIKIEFWGDEGGYLFPKNGDGLYSSRTKARQYADRYLTTSNCDSVEIVKAKIIVEE